MADLRHRARLQAVESCERQASAGGNGGLQERTLCEHYPLDMSGPMQAIAKFWWNARYSVRRFRDDRRGLAATEFAIVVPLMLVMFFGTVEFSSAVAIDRKVTLMARTLSDLTSQTPSPG